MQRRKSDPAKEQRWRSVSATPTFIPIELLSSTPTSIPFELDLPNGCILKIPPQFDVNKLTQILGVLV